MRTNDQIISEAVEKIRKAIDQGPWVEAVREVRKARREYGFKMLLIGLLAGFIIGVFYTLATG